MADRFSIQIPTNDIKRTEDLRKYDILDTDSDEPLKMLVEIVALIFNVPLAVITMVDAKRAFYKESTLEKYDGVSLPRDKSYCSFAILSDEVTVFKDTYVEPCLLTSRELVEQIGYRFYAGAPIRSSAGYNIGTVAIVDKTTRDFGETEQLLLKKFSKLIMDEIELRSVFRKEVNDLQQTSHQRNELLRGTLQELKKTQNELNHFIYRASHDLKGPISTIEGLVNLASNEVSEENMRDYVHKIKSVNSAMNELLGKLTTIYSILRDQGITSLKKTILNQDDLRNIISAVISELKSRVKKGKTEFKLAISPLRCEMNEADFKLILFNLIENAIHFRKQNHEHVQVVTIKAAEENGKVKLLVHDNGEGIPKDQEENTFELFFRGSSSSRTGMGLYLVKKIVERAKGEIDLRSVYGKYTEVRLLIPTSQ